METDVGFVCGRCDTFAPLDATECAACGHALAFAGRPEPVRALDEAPVSGPPSEPGGITERLASLVPPRLESEPIVVTRRVSGPPPARTSDRPPSQPALARRSPPSLVPPPVTDLDLDLDRRGDHGAPRDGDKATPFIGPVRIPAGFVLTESLMEQARTYVCKNPICHTPVPPGHKFCGRCGESVPREILTAQTLMLSRMLEPGKAKLVVIKGEGIASDASDETAYLLGGKSHVVGRSEGQIVFDRDNWVSPRHASFYYRDDGKLVLKDEGALNGVFVRVRQPIELAVGDMVLAGEQVLRLEASPRGSDHADGEGTSFYSSPKRQSPFRVAQTLRGGSVGMLLAARESTVTIGRDNCDMNFPNDPFMSGRHCKIELGAGGKFTLTDMNSKNGTYLRLRGEREMAHGDYIFIGRELLRVDISA